MTDRTAIPAGRRELSPDTIAALDSRPHQVPKADDTPGISAKSVGRMAGNYEARIRNLEDKVAELVAHIKTLEAQRPGALVLVLEVAKGFGAVMLEVAKGFGAVMLELVKDEGIKKSIAWAVFFIGGAIAAALVVSVGVTHLSVKDGVVSFIADESAEVQSIDVTQPASEPVTTPPDLGISPDP